MSPRLGRRMARINRLVNRLMRPLARRLPEFGLVSHIGRTSSRTDRTAAMMIRTGDVYLIAIGDPRPGRER